MQECWAIPVYAMGQHLHSLKKLFVKCVMYWNCKKANASVRFWIFNIDNICSQQQHLIATDLQHGEQIRNKTTDGNGVQRLFYINPLKSIYLHKLLGWKKQSMLAKSKRNPHVWFPTVQVSYQHSRLQPYRPSAESYARWSSQMTSTISHATNTHASF